MPQRKQHCPYLNRADDRCAEHFSLDNLRHAFHFCFDTYQACPVYFQLVAERRVKHGTDALSVSGSSMADTSSVGPMHFAHHDATPPVIQVTISDRYKKRPSGPASAAASSGF